MVDLNKFKKEHDLFYDLIRAVVIAMLIILVVFMIVYHAVNVSINNTDDAICKEKYLSDGVVSFKFIRKNDNKELTYDMRESETNIVTFDRLNSKLKKGVSCQIVTNGFDNVQEVKISIDD